MSASRAPTLRRLFLYGFVCVVMTSVGVGLGMWQLARAAGKIALAQAEATRAALPVLDLADVWAASGEMLRHRRVRLRGHWLADQTTYLDNRQMDGKVGFYVVTPLELQPPLGATEGLSVLVQRGWIQRDFEDRNRLQPVTTPGGPVEIEGRIEPALSRTFSLAPPDAEKGVSPIRQNLDPEEFSTETGLAVAPFVVIETGAPDQGLRRDWPPVDLGVQRHYGYAFQWFALAVLALFLYARLGVLPFLRRGRAPST